MAFPKGSSRPIEVDATRFRYVVSVSASGETGWFSLNLTIQVEDGRGSLLKARGLLTRDRWLDFPELDTPDRYLTLKPVHVAAVIRRACANGWHPEETGSPFLLEIGPDVLQT